jgi:hypothetical protein
MEEPNGRMQLTGPALRRFWVQSPSSRPGNGCWRWAAEEQTMNKRRLIVGLGALLLIAGAALACCTPGGLFNRESVTSVNTPFGSFSKSEAVDSPWPVIGYVLLGLGGVGIVVGLALKSPKE